MRSATGADAALTNGGGIRGDRTYAAGTVLTRKDILTELPFGNVAVLLELEGGADLRRRSRTASRRSRTGPAASRRSRACASPRTPRPPGRRRIVEVTVAGAPARPGPHATASPPTTTSSAAATATPPEARQADRRCLGRAPPRLHRDQPRHRPRRQDRPRDRWPDHAPQLSRLTACGTPATSAPRPLPAR